MGDIAFAAIPTVIFTPRAAGGLEVDFFDLVLTDIRDEQVTGRPVEGEAVGVAHPNRPDLVAGIAVRHEGIARRDAVNADQAAAPDVTADGTLAVFFEFARGRQVVDVDAQHFAQELIRVLSSIERIISAAAVAHADVEVSIGPKMQVAPVVIGEILLDFEHHQERVAIGDIRIAGGTGETGDGSAVEPRSRRIAGVVEVKEAVVFVVGMEGETEQALLVAGVVHQTGDIEKGGAEKLCRILVENLDDARLLDQEKTRGSVPGMADGHHIGQVDDRGEAEVGRRGPKAGRRDGQQQKGRKAARDWKYPVIHERSSFWWWRRPNRSGQALPGTRRAVASAAKHIEEIL